jgi:hypothetical protein
MDRRHTLARPSPRPPIPSHRYPGSPKLVNKPFGALARIGIVEP